LAAAVGDAASLIDPKNPYKIKADGDFGEEPFNLNKANAEMRKAVAAE